MKKCKCGCSIFKATIKEEVEIDGTVEFFADGDANIEEDDHECVISSDYDGPFECTECGMVYETENDIPDDSDKNVNDDRNAVSNDVKTRIGWTISGIKSSLAEAGYSGNDIIMSLIMENIEKNLSDYI